MGPDKQEEFKSYVREQINQRFVLGEERYQSSVLGFVGDPLAHSWEEILDAAFYIWQAKRERDELKRQIAQAEHTIRQLRQQIASGGTVAGRGTE